MADINLLSCARSLRNLGGCNCDQVMGLVKGLVFTPDDYTYATRALAETQSEWQDGIQKKSLYKLPEAFTIEAINIDEEVETGTFGKTIVKKQAKPGLRMKMIVPMYVYNRLFSFDGQGGRVYMMMENGKTLACTPDGTKVRGLEIYNLRVKPYMLAGDGETPMCSVEFNLKNYEEYTESLVIIDTDFFEELTPLADVVLAASLPAVTGFRVSVTRACDGSGVAGLVVGDFVLVDDAAGSETISSLTPVAGSPGTYDAAATLGADNYVLNLVSSATMTTDGYDSTGSTTFTVS